MPVMDLSPQTQLAALTARLSFQSPARTVERLLLFSLAEEGTMIELEQAASLTEDPDRAAAYLRHAADESRHARMFVARAREIASEHGIPLPVRRGADSSDLFRSLGEIDFLAFVHRGEARGRARFAGWRRAFSASGDHKTASLFEALERDERQHETYSLALLSSLAGEQRARGALRKVALRSAWQGYQRLARATGEVLYALLLWALLPMLLPLGWLVRRAQPDT